MTGYYDVVLGLIPLTLAGISGSLVFAGYQPTTAVPLAGLVTVGLMGHAMFVNSPVTPKPEAAEPAAESTPFDAAD
ncbi:hypothetical protein ACKVMT_02015 [Halobacteriales archaeon Cl-PHB]